MKKRKVAKRKRTPKLISADQLKGNYTIQLGKDADDILNRLRDLEMTYAGMAPQYQRWPFPKFGFSSHVHIKPIARRARIIEVRNTGRIIQYSVRYYVDDRPVTMWVFEDELE